MKDEDVKVFAGRIYKEAQRLIRLVGDVIRISRLDEAVAVSVGKTGSLQSDS